MDFQAMDSSGEFILGALFWELSFNYVDFLYFHFSTLLLVFKASSNDCGAESEFVRPVNFMVIDRVYRSLVAGGLDLGFWRLSSGFKRLMAWFWRVAMDYELSDIVVS